MISKDKINEVIKGLCSAIVAYDREKAADWTKIALELGIDPYTIVTDGVATGMSQVGELFRKKEYFLAELCICSEAALAALDLLQPHIRSKKGEIKGRIVIGTVEGDIHDIGKNIVAIMLRASGWTVHDVGKDVPPYKFLEELQKADAHVLALSALTSATMQAIPRVVELVKAHNPRVAIIVGGAAVTRDSADRYGADGYADSAANADQEVTEMLSRLNQKRTKSGRAI